LNRFARSLGLVRNLPASLRQRYREIGIDLPDGNGDNSHGWPAPAVYVVDSDGVSRFAHGLGLLANHRRPCDKEGVAAAERLILKPGEK